MQDGDWLDRERWLARWEGENEAPGRESAEVGKPEGTRRPRKRSSGFASAGLTGLIRTFSPWQRFLLALLLFLNVALLGCMCLVMTGRVVLVAP